MSITGFFILVVIFIAIMLLYKNADRYVKRLKPKTVKTVNWIGFVAAIIGGILWYASNNEIFMLMTLAGVVTYFIFYNYDKTEDKE